ncbi:MAG: hypothetical protein JO060_07580 [Candidatus Eremiobacteraeota bacterium]|nr:hypothetical protein [Candidatus Eremiobacteraeota bacterium]MBV9646861.1 hypothetical protein [Candidatus Eremiobacteraeota bacterium]
MTQNPFRAMLFIAGFCAFGAAADVAAGTPPRTAPPHALSAGSAHLGTIIPSPPPRRHGPKPQGWRSDEATAAKSLIYVASGDHVEIYPQRGHNPPPIGMITDGVLSAYGLYVDAMRNLYVCNWHEDSVAVYPPGGTTPSAVYTVGVRGPLYAAVDAAGTLFVSNGADGTIVEYAKGHKSPTRFLFTLGDEADGIALDAAGNLYAAYRKRATGNGGIMFFSKGSPRGQDLGIALLAPQGLAIDTSGNILVVETNGKDVIDTFPPHQTKPSQQIAVRGVPTQITLTQHLHHLYVSDLNRHVYAQTYPNGRLHGKLRDPQHLSEEQGIAVSPAESL